MLEFNVRNYYIADEGTVLIFQDAAQQEYRLLAHYGNDTNFMAMCQEGFDVHIGAASLLFGVPYDDVTDAERDKGKTGNFATVYGIGNPHMANSFGYPIDEKRLKQGTAHLYKTFRPWKMPPYSTEVSYELACGGVTDPEILDGIQYFYTADVQAGLKFAADFKKKYFSQFPGIKQFTKDCAKAGEDRGYVKTWTGRRRHFKNPKLEAYKAPNAVIQGGCGDIIKVKCHQVNEFLKANGYKTRILNLVHDEMTTQHPYDEIYLVPLINEILKELPFRVPISWGIDWSPRGWGDKRPFVSVEQTLREVGQL